MGKCYSGLDPMEDTEGSSDVHQSAPVGRGYSGLDPMEDTESAQKPSLLCRLLLRYSGLDPMEDTERKTTKSRRVRRAGLQWARSDGGY